MSGFERWWWRHDVLGFGCLWGLRTAAQAWRDLLRMRRAARLLHLGQRPRERHGGGGRRGRAASAAVAAAVARRRREQRVAARALSGAARGRATGEAVAPGRALP